ncbi:uncharacterized protein LOC130384480 isoform X1 [Gadus chalcogrammus]|uniref:uncharacterized protein LOC130384480 isoform X1 n=1 Tax=Gadus chalcogrammus TaxID=1042646 RepID=UPI0024C3EB80|nr:uncharacterized protein LOC130384480 isoform X1 [Gadus chalcogrammus]
MACKRARHDSCSVFGCTNEHKNLFFVPSTEPLKNQWVNFIFSGNARVCAKHFTDDCFLNLGQYRTGLAKRLKLKSRSVPTLLGSASNLGQASTTSDYIQPLISRDIACQTDHLEAHTVGTQLSLQTLRPHLNSDEDGDAFGDRSTQCGATSESLRMDAPGTYHRELKILSVYGKGEGPLALDGHDTLFTTSEMEALNSLSVDDCVAKSLDRGERLVCRMELGVQQQPPGTISIKVEEDISGEDCDAFGDRSTQRGAASESLRVDTAGSSNMSSHSEELKILSFYGKGEGPLAVGGHDTLFTASEVETPSSLFADHSVATGLRRSERLVRHKELSVQEQFSGDELLSDQDSDPESEISQIYDEKYILQSDEDDGEDPDASLDFMPQSKVKPVMPDVGASRSDTSVQDVAMVPSAAVASESGDSNQSEEMPEAEAERRKQEVTLQNTTIKNYCYVCGKPQSKISRHLKLHRKHAELVLLFSLPEKSKERKILLEKIRNKGNFKHNTTVLQAGEGPLKVKRQPKANIMAEKFIHCVYCRGMYIRKELWRHVRRCPCKPEGLNEEPGRTKVLGLAAAQESASCQQISCGVWKLLGVMKQDEVAIIVRNDLSIIQFAQSLYNKHGQDPTKYDYIRQKIREVGRFLLCLHTEFSIHTMEEAVKPANFQRVMRAVKKVSGFDEETHSFLTPSLALKLGHSLHKICDIIHCRALMAEDEDRIRSTDIFKKLYTSKWSELVSHGALNTLRDPKYHKPSTLHFTEDVQIFHRYLDKSAEEAFGNLKEVATSQNYARLAKVTLAQIIVFNRRRAGEVSKMLLKSFLERDNTKPHEDVAMGLSKTEQRLCNYFCRVEMMEKGGRKVAVLLTPSMVDALSLLASNRTESGVCATNLSLFARPKAMSHYRGHDCLRVHASQCGAKHPEHLRSTQLRKHVATLSRVLNLKNNELDQVADFSGNDIRVHRDFYRLPVPTTQLAKISKLLLSMEKGHLSGMQGKSLDEIEIDDEMVLSDAEANDDGSKYDSSDTADLPSECVTSEPVETASWSTITEQLHDTKYIGKDSGKEHGSRRAKKKVWSKVEVAAVMRHFKDPIRKGIPASINECRHCKQAEGPALTHRTLQNIRDFVRNRGIAAKRQAPKPTDTDH